mgnify:CR=1 FL=1
MRSGRPFWVSNFVIVLISFVFLGKHNNYTNQCCNNSNKQDDDNQCASAKTLAIVCNSLRTSYAGEVDALAVYLVVSLAMFIAIVVAKLIGCSLPIFAKLVRIDPALMAGPMIATLVDIVTLVIYFALANAFLI